MRIGRGDVLAVCAIVFGGVVGGMAFGSMFGEPETVTVRRGDTTVSVTVSPRRASPEVDAAPRPAPAPRAIAAPRAEPVPRATPAPRAAPAPRATPAPEAVPAPRVTPPPAAAPAPPAPQFRARLRLSGSPAEAGMTGPILFVDDVRVESGFLTDIAPGDIGRVEVFKGADAAALVDDADAATRGVVKIYRKPPSEGGAGR